MSESLKAQRTRRTLKGKCLN